VAGYPRWQVACSRHGSPAGKPPIGGGDGIFRPEGDADENPDNRTGQNQGAQSDAAQGNRRSRDRTLPDDRGGGLLPRAGTQLPPGNELDDWLQAERDIDARLERD
jgi:hypothetical protein